MRKKLLLLSIIIGAILALAAYFQHLQNTQSSAPIPTRGRSFTSYRDSQGVAHITGNTIYDVVYAQGYDHAQQRLFQMDTMRRVISGRLSELIGEKTIPIDKYFRTLGIGHAVGSSLGQLTEYQSKLLESFAEGVNDYALKDMKIHPLEYWLTNSKFQKWEAQDSLLLTKLIYYQMTFDFQFQVMREKMAEAVGWDLLDQVITYKESQFTWGTNAYILNDEELEQSGFLGTQQNQKGEQPKSKAGLKQEEKPKQNTQSKENNTSKQQKQKKAKQDKKPSKGGEYLNQNHGSNCWAVHGNHTASGRPMLMGDPHLGNAIPATWIINYLSVKGNYTFGAALPGLPGVFIGRTSVSAQSMTAMGADVADLFSEKIQGNKYFYNGTWHKLKERKELIKVKGGEPVELTVQSTKHGPLFHNQISSVSYAFLGKVEWDQSKPISIRWSASEHPIDKFQFGTYFATPQLINTGDNLIKSYLNNYNGFQASVCFITINGDIGYMGGVKHPVRNMQDSHKINQGWIPQNEWKQYTIDQDLPYIINPKKGFVSCSNQRIASDKMHFPFANNMAPMSRAVTQHQALSAYIKKGKKITVQDMMALQYNIYDSYAQQALPLMLCLIQQSTQQEFQDTIQILKKWDLKSQENSIGASIYYMWETLFLAGLFEDFQFKNGLDQKLSYFRNFMWEQWFMGSLRDWANGKNTQNLICGKKELKPEGNCVNLMRKSFIQAHNILIDKLGEDKQLWVWSHLHRMHYTHSMSRTPLKPFFHKSYASLGTRRNLNVAGYYVNDEFTFDGVHSANLRVLIDMGSSSYWSLDMVSKLLQQGNSGIKGTPHYDDLHDQHQSGGYVKMEHNYVEK